MTTTTKMPANAYGARASAAAPPCFKMIHRDKATATNPISWASRIGMRACNSNVPHSTQTNAASSWAQTRVIPKTVTRVGTSQRGELIPCAVLSQTISNKQHRQSSARSADETSPGRPFCVGYDGQARPIVNKCKQPSRVTAASIRTSPQKRTPLDEGSDKLQTARWAFI